MTIAGSIHGSHCQIEERSIHERTSSTSEPFGGVNEGEHDLWVNEPVKDDHHRPTKPDPSHEGTNRKQKPMFPEDSLIILGLDGP